MQRRYLSIWLPYLSTDLLLGQRSDWHGRPVCLFVCDRRGQTVVAVSREAERCGLAAGMGLADARAVEPSLLSAELQPAAIPRALMSLCSWADRFTPLAALDAPDGLCLDITGCAHLFGGECAMRRTILDRLARHGFTGRAAIAGTPGAAWGLARYAAGHRTSVRSRSGGDPTHAAVWEIASGQEKAALADLPVAALRLDADLCRGLYRLGLRRIGDLYGMPRAGLARRFGERLPDRLDQVLGMRPDPISPHRPAAAFRVRLHFAEPIAAPASITGAVTEMIGQVCRQLADAGKGARRFCARFHRVDDPVDRPPQTVIIGTTLLGRDARALHRLFAERLDRLEPGPGFETVLLEAGGVAVLQALQSSLEPARAAPPEALADLLDRLGNRLGSDSLWQAVPRESWDPERAVGRRRPLEPIPGVEQRGAEEAGKRTRDKRTAGKEGHDRHARDETSVVASEPAPWPLDRPRPIRLIAPPEPVEVTAPVPDDPPVLLRRRGRVHRLIRAEGPERIGPEWWLGQRETRDYYRVEDAEGHRFWLYRTGTYNDASPPRWFLHGLFG